MLKCADRNEESFDVVVLSNIVEEIALVPLCFRNFSHDFRMKFLKISFYVT